MKPAQRVQVVQSQGGNFKEGVSCCEEAETMPLRSQDMGLGAEDLLQANLFLFSGVASLCLRCLMGVWEPGSC